MTGQPRKRSFAARPADPESWIKSLEATPSLPSRDAGFTARLTIDITLELRGRIKITAFERGTTVTEMLRDLLAREFPPPSGDPS